MASKSKSEAEERGHVAVVRRSLTIVVHQRICFHVEIYWIKKQRNYTNKYLQVILYKI
jgi:hypothetical protein